MVEGLRLLVVDVAERVGVPASAVSVRVLAASGSSDVTELSLAGAGDLVHEEVLGLAEVGLDLLALRVVVGDRPPRLIDVLSPRVLNIVVRLDYVVAASADQDLVGNAGVQFAGVFLDLLGAWDRNDAHVRAGLPTELLDGLSDSFLHLLNVGV